ncbi:MAG: prolipoprotein diacylglyceryl transferase, partial [Ruminococcus sp.]|nr:prolipoprotein diacylglyceryl transferase [Ruminococcus sp.]
IDDDELDILNDDDDDFDESELDALNDDDDDFDDDDDNETSVKLVGVSENKKDDTEDEESDENKEDK